MSKITIYADKAYIIRSTRTKPSGECVVVYYETPAIWNKSPLEATIFRTFDGGQAHLNMYSSRDKAEKGWADGSVEVFDVVPLYGEILNSPNVTRITPKK